MPNRTTNAIHSTNTTSNPTTSSTPPYTSTTFSLSSILYATHNAITQLRHATNVTCSKQITARSRRKRRRHHREEEEAASRACIIPSSINATQIVPTPASYSHTNHKYSLLTFSCENSIHKSMLAYLLAATTLLLLTTACFAASPCDSHSWWDPVKDKCIPCTVCEGEMIPLRPCQLHRDTICGSIYDLKIDWVVLAKTEPNWKERRKSDGDSDGEFNLEQQLTHEQLQQLHEETVPLDWQTAALFLAVLACLLFFIAAACILVHHMRQWRRMERRLDQDVEELSTKLMAKLAEVQSLEGGTFFIGNADALRVPTTFQPQHVLLPEKPAKHNERRFMKTLQPGNVYIEENGSKG